MATRTERWRKLAAAACLATFLISAPCEAQDADPRVTARQVFARAEQAFAEDDLPQALELFRRAFELVPNDAVRFNIAVCLERLGRFREAAAEYQQAAESTSLDAATRARAVELGSRTRERLGTLLVRGSPLDAEVWIDDRRECALPCTVALDPGVHRVRVVGPASSVEETVSVSRGTTSELALSADAIAAPVIAPTARRGFELSWLGWTGMVLTGGGLGTTIGLGVTATDLHGQYLSAPDASTREAGILARDGTNVAIGVAALGATLLVIDLVRAGVQENDPVADDPDAP